MKILITGSKEYPTGSNKGFDPQPSGGVERYVEELAHGLSKKHNVVLLTRKFPSTKAHEKNGNISVYRVPFKRGFWSRNISFNAQSFVKSLSLDFDVIITNDLIASVFGLVAGLAKRRPVIMVCHGKVSNQPQYPLIVRIILRLLENVYNLSWTTVCHTRYQAKKVGDKNARIIRPGLKKMKADYSLKGKYSKPTIVLVNRLEQVKGADILIKAMDHINGRYSCVIVGDGSEKKRLMALAAKNKNIYFTGYRDDVEKFYSIADVFVLPSKTESLSYSMLEAMSFGLPCVATVEGIAPKGTVVQAKRTPKSLAQGISTALKTKKIRGKGLKYSKQFNWKRAIVEYNKLLRSVA